MAFTAIEGAKAELNQSPPPNGAPTTRAISQSPGHESDMYDGGKFKVVGTTKIIGSPGIPVSRYVRLHDTLSGRVIRAQWSDSITGVYTFENIRFGTFYIMAEDYTQAFNGVIKTNITSEPM